MAAVMEDLGCMAVGQWSVGNHCGFCGILCVVVVLRTTERGCQKEAQRADLHPVTTRSPVTNIDLACRRYMIESVS